VEGDVSVAEGRGLGGEECLCGLEGVRMGLLMWGVEMLGRCWTVGLAGGVCLSYRMTIAFGNGLIVAVYPENATQTAMRSCVMTLVEHKSTQHLSFELLMLIFTHTLNPCLNSPFMSTPKLLCAILDSCT